MRYIGIDAGSVSVKLVILDESGEVLHKEYRPHRGHPIEMAVEMLGAADVSGECSLAVTGTSGKLIASILGMDPVNEIVAQAYSTQKLHPHVNTIIEMGGEDSKLIVMDDSGVRDFAMNSVCAAGTGSFLDQQAERLRLSIEEFSEMALRSAKPPRIAGRCSVFAKSDMIHLQQIATPVEDIVAGLCFAVARNFRGTIARGTTIVPPVAFQGGVAANSGMVRAFREVFELDDLFIPPDFALMGALGAALKSLDDGAISLYDRGMPAKLMEFVEGEKASGTGHRPLTGEGDDFFRRHSEAEPDQVGASGPVRAYLGIDIGSISTNLAVMDDDGKLLAKRYLMTAGRPIEAVMQGMREIAEEIARRFPQGIEIAGVGTTGSGRYMIGDYVGADIVKNEITAHATAAAYVDPDVDTIFEIGGQDSKYVSLRDGVIVDFEMNKACAAGTGSFLEEQAEKLSISVKGEFAEKAFCSSCPSKLGERCTVFMENSLMSNLKKGTRTDDLLAGLAYSIVQNYINRVVAGKPIGENIFFQGGVAFNKSVVAAFEKYLDVKVTVPKDHDVMGAIGMALLARRHVSEMGMAESAFKGFDLSERGYEMSSFQCKGCSNVCEINRIRIEREEGFLYYGGRCEKYDINKKKRKAEVPDLFGWRESLLRAERPSHGTGPRIGIPYIFFFHEQLPYWQTLLNELGFRVEVSPGTNREIMELGNETVLSEACFPVKVSLGHIKWLMDKGVDAVFIPSFADMNAAGDEFDHGRACPYTQTIPYMARVAMPGLKTISPVIDLSRGRGHLKQELLRALDVFGVSPGAMFWAMRAAERKQAEFDGAVKEKGKEVLASVDRKSLVVVGRAYNAMEKGMNLRIPEKLASLGVLSIPMDMLPLEETADLKEEWPNMYWRSGQRILRAARHISRNPYLYPLYIGNFSCGPDSFILKFFKKELGGKPFLHIEIDEHSADAGAVTRCEAFLDSIEHRRDEPPERKAPRRRAAQAGGKKRMVFIPHMADHAYALAAAFERAGVPAEVLPQSDRESVDVGMRYVSGKECYPCIVTTGDMVKRTLQPDFRPEESAFFMPSGTGPCRFGQYNVFHTQVLESVGFNNVPVLAPNQDKDFYKELGMLGKDFARDAWYGIVAIELLEKSLRETRPYEKNKGETDRLYGEYLERAYTSLRGMDGAIEDVLVSARRDFEDIPTHDEPKPLVGIMGEIFVRCNRFSNEDLVRKVESLGGEVWLAPVEEWIYYVSVMGLRKALIKKDVSAIIDTLIKDLFKKSVERKYARHFEGFLRTLHEPPTKRILENAAPYVPDSFEGETVLSIGKAVDFAEKGCSGVINAMPFGCMPGTIVTALMRAVSRDFDLPAISIPYDGTESSAIEMQLEAFMDQARTKAEKTRKRR
ncbi:MAG: acyl-CoA dehydratase activase [Nitrospirota bacterium]|jgi:predicted CoA-substrate-specific enzyme activase